MKVFKFEEWSEATINEATEEKDIKRIGDIIVKADGDETKMKVLATTMAKLIQDKDKAMRRAEAAEQLLGAQNPLSPIFYDKAKELGATVPTNAEIEKQAREEKKEDDAKQLAPEDPVTLTKIDKKKGNQIFLVPLTKIRNTVGYYGEITKWNNKKGISKTVTGWDFYNSYYKKTSDPRFMYMKVDKVGFLWVEGTLEYSNCTIDESRIRKNQRVRVRIERDLESREIKTILQPGPELKIFQSNEKEIAKAMERKYYIDGREGFLMNVTGESAREIAEGEYEITSLNFELSESYKEPVFTMYNRKVREENGLCWIKMSDLGKLTEELGKEQLEVIAEWFSKEIGAMVIYQPGYNYGAFKIPTVKVIADKGKFLQDFSAGPFLSVDQAEEYIDSLKKSGKNLTFDVNTLRISKDSYNHVSLSLEQLIQYATLVGIKVTIKDLLKVKRGNITAKKFGI
jgi:hypothetical protein